MYTILGLLFGTGSPLVVVYSGSMEPVLFRGDVMGLKASNNDLFFGPEVTLNINLSRTPVSDFATPIYTGNDFSALKLSNGVEVPYEKDGSIVVYTAYNPYDLAVDTHGKPIIHRAILKIHANDGTFILTKGDSVANFSFDQDCGPVVYDRPTKQCISLYPIKTTDIQGVAFFNIPKVGCVKLWLFEDLLSILGAGKLPKDFKGIC